MLGVIYLANHGEVEVNNESDCNEIEQDYPLTERGERQSEVLASHISSQWVIKTIFSSPYQGCIGTAKAISLATKSTVNVCTGCTKLDEKSSCINNTDPVCELLSFTSLEEFSTENIEERSKLIAKYLLNDSNKYDQSLIISRGCVISSIVKSLIESYKISEEHLDYTACCSVKLSANSELLQEFEAPFQKTSDWCSVHFPYWRIWFGEMSKSPVDILEIGSWEGASALFWLKEVCKHDKSHLVLLDHFDCNEGAGKERRKRLDFNLSLTQYFHKVRVVPAFSQPGIAKLLDEEKSFNVIYIDGDHTRKGVLMDGLLAWQALRTNGLMLFDDYKLPTAKSQPPSYPSSIFTYTEPPDIAHPAHPKEGIDAFLEIVRDEIKILHKGYQILIQRISLGPFYSLPVYPNLIQVVLLVTESYVMGAAVSIRSLLHYCSDVSNICLSIVDLGLKPCSRLKLGTIVTGMTQNACSVNWIDSEQFKSMGHKQAKLCLAREVSLCTKRFLYLDADILVCDDIIKLWKSVENRANGAIGAVRDFGFPSGTEELIDHGWDKLRHQYFNAGMMVVDTKKFAAAESNMLRCLKSKIWKFSDQDVLNLEFKDNWYSIDYRWNLQGLGSYAHHRVHGDPASSFSALYSDSTLEHLSSEPGIVHFNGASKFNFVNYYVNAPQKPWSGISNNPWTKKWFDMLDETPWKGWRPNKDTMKAHFCTSVDEFIEKIWNVPQAKHEQNQILCNSPKY